MAEEPPAESPHKVGLSLSEAQAIQLFHAAAARGLHSLRVRRVVRMAEVQGGYNNKTYQVDVEFTTDDNSTVARTGTFAVQQAKASVWPIAKMESQRDAMRFVRRRTSIPVPEVLFATAPLEEVEGMTTSPAGGGWWCVVTSWMPGEPFTEALWQRMAASARDTLVRQLVDTLLALQSITFPLIGRFANDSMEPFFDLCGFARFEEGARDADDSLEEDCVGVGMPEEALERALAASFVGPFSCIFTYLRQQLRMRILELRLHCLRGERDHNPRLAKLQTLLQITMLVWEDRFSPHAAPWDSTAFAIVATHGDFAGRNILVDPVAGHITGVIDWEWFSAQPADKDVMEGLDDIPDECCAAMEAEALRRCDEAEPSRDPSTCRSLWRSLTLYAGKDCGHPGAQLLHDVMDLVGDVVPWFLSAHLKDPAKFPVDDALFDELVGDSVKHVEKFFSKYGHPPSSSLLLK